MSLEVSRGFLLFAALQLAGPSTGKADGQAPDQGGQLSVENPEVGRQINQIVHNIVYAPEWREAFRQEALVHFVLVAWATEHYRQT